MIFATTAVRHARTFSVMPSDSTMMRYAKRKRSIGHGCTHGIRRVTHEIRSTRSTPAGLCWSRSAALAAFGALLAIVLTALFLAGAATARFSGWASIRSRRSSATLPAWQCSISSGERQQATPR